MNVMALPKVELHLHLDCSLSYDVVQRLAPHISLEDYRREFVAPTKCTNLADFLTRAPKGFALMQSREALRAVVDDLFAQLVRDGVIYAEIRFAPLLHMRGGLRDHEVVGVVDEATRAAAARTGIEGRVILCTLRHLSEEESMRTVRLVDRFAGTSVAAFDIAGDEAGYPIDAHVAAYQYAIERGLARTAHAGEAAGPESVWETLQAFQPSRIGHGVRCVEDDRLVEHLVRTRIHLEVCPTSNVQTNICDTFVDHPIDRLYRRGVSIGINTDTRTITDVTLNEEYTSLGETFAWGRNDLLRCNLDAVDAAFIPDDVKARLRDQLIAAYGRLPEGQ
jgi:adenosine deaminase